MRWKPSMGRKIAGGGAFGEDAVARALSLEVMVWASVVLPVVC